MTTSISEVAPGSRTFYQVPVCTLVSGIEVNLTIHVLRGTKPGPTLGLLSTLHGAEFLSIEQVRAILEGIDLDQLSGTVIACLVANPIALQHGSVATPTDHVNMNRVFPGSSGDDLLTKYAGGVTEYMAHLVTKHLIEPCDMLFDFHLGPFGHADEMIDVPIQADEARMERLHLMGSLFGTLMHEWELPPGSSLAYAISQGKLGLGVEIGGGGYGDELSAKWVRQAAAGVHASMQYLGMLPGTPPWPESVNIVTIRAGLRPLHGGYHVPVIGTDRLGTTIEKGKLLGRTYNTQTLELIEELHSPHRGLLYMIRAYGLVDAGDWGYVMTDESGQRTYHPKP